jgi:hypothetical protein
MFTWICPTCGREVPPAYNDCPDCSAKQNPGEAAPAPQAAAEAPAPAAPPAPRPAPAAVKPAAPRAAKARRGLPTWLLSILFALGFMALGVGSYWGVNYMRGRNAAPRPAPEAPAAAGAPAKPHPLQQYIEVTGVRFVQDEKKRTEARFLVVNHSPDDIMDLGGTVTILGRTQKAGEEQVGTFSFKAPSLGPWQSREFVAPIETRLRVYELPDWQNLIAQVVITAP